MARTPGLRRRGPGLTQQLAQQLARGGRRRPATRWAEALPARRLCLFLAVVALPLVADTASPLKQHQERQGGHDVHRMASWNNVLATCRAHGAHIQFTQTHNAVASTWRRRTYHADCPPLPQAPTRRPRPRAATASPLAAVSRRPTGCLTCTTWRAASRSRQLPARCAPSASVHCAALGADRRGSAEKPWRPPPATRCTPARLHACVTVAHNRMQGHTRCVNRASWTSSDGPHSWQPGPVLAF